jgi:hypothetical protein
MEKGQKKRGRKPKGGKILDAVVHESQHEEVMHNIILHLKCSFQETLLALKDDGGIEAFTEELHHESYGTETEESTLHHKLKTLQSRLHTNMEMKSRSDCFWCTQSFDSPTIHIPKGKTGDTYQVYGCFCCPECAAGYLFNESRLDASCKFERYHMLNFLYGSVYEYDHAIVPAPPPHYFLNKFLGILSIEQYHQMIRQNKFVLVAEKPMCASYPELMQSAANFESLVIQSKKPEQTAYRLCRKKS